MENNKDICKILQLSDCAMMYILSFLDATSLFNLSRTCLYFNNIVKDPKLWLYIDGRNKPNTTSKVKYICKRVHDKTTHLLLKAENRYNGNVSQDYLLSWRRFQLLTVLALENQRFDGSNLKLNSFPKSLEELSLKKTYIKNGKFFFQGSFQGMRNLRVLVLDQCNWIDSSSLMSVAKYENLEILSLVKCLKLHFNIMPYLSVAKHGFKKLKLIDSRLNTISNEILRSFNTHISVVALYCQSMRSYELDKGRPLLMDKYHSLRSENKQILLESIIKDETLEQFLHTVGSSLEYFPNSILYQDPYPDCSCGYADKVNREDNVSNNENDNSELLSMYADDYIDFQPSDKFLCRKHLGDLKKISSGTSLDNESNRDSASSLDDSSSDDSGNCCMFGREKNKKIIVLKVREADERGNMPEAEIIDFSKVNNLRKKKNENDTSNNIEEAEKRINDPEPKPSTSKEEVQKSSQNSGKRKLTDSNSELYQKKKKFDESTESNLDLSKPSTSSLSHSSKKDNKNTASDSDADSDLDLSKPSTSGLSHSSMKDNEVLKKTASDSDADSSEEDAKLEYNREQNENRDRNTERPQRFSARPASAWLSIGGISKIRVGIYGSNQLLEPQDDQFRFRERPLRKVSIRRLSLRGYRGITNTTLELIKNINLSLLDVTYTSVTKAAIEEYLIFNPNCRVVHENFCVCKPRIPC
ncbi:uncharacterized protein LOC115883118 isoform X3 [Sitophilus oryzae]|uniref:Uncharacterized protein LOC115883118 isoform X3 n=1 Tax=Sitophilus oryzae TaxID=7048 RepID=A0A6J2Y1X4_SITOR|nr:uncharacterized protein LOC115883118 isoform X3 [Sitophilus oryzae]